MIYMNHPLDKRGWFFVFFELKYRIMKNENNQDA